MSDRKRIAQLERDVERLEAACMWLAEEACRDRYHRVWLPQAGPIARLAARHRNRKRTKEKSQSDVFNHSERSS